MVEGACDGLARGGGESRAEEGRIGEKGRPARSLAPSIHEFSRGEERKKGAEEN